MQLRLWCPTSWQFQQTGPNFPIDVDAKDNSEELCLTPRLFRLLDAASSVEGELVLSDWWFLVGAGGGLRKVVAAVAHCPATVAIVLVLVSGHLSYSSSSWVEVEQVVLSCADPRLLG